MATHLDLEEQEQLERVKHFWKRYGTLITLTLALVLAGFAGWQGWQWWQRDESGKAAAMYDELERAVRDADKARIERASADLRQQFPRTAFAQQGALLAARAQFEAGDVEPAIASLRWAADQATEAEYRVVARLRLAGLLIDQKKPDEALQLLDGATGAPAFDALVQDRRGDALMAQGKVEDAKAAWTRAWNAMGEQVEYRRLIEAKLNAAGVSPVRAEGRS
jgi:predicted negative regulator of RcsB-dependent stress response